MARKHSAPALTPGEKLRRAREASGLPAYKVARDCLGIAQPTLSQYEHGRGSPSVHLAFAIESWTKKLAEQLARPELVVRAIDWVDEEHRGIVAGHWPEMLEAS